MYIIKKNGTTEPFQPEKISAGLARAGASPELIKKIIDDVKAKTHDSISTKELEHIIKTSLKQHNEILACKYDLRDALIKLGPSGFAFEQYISRLLHEYGFTTEVPEKELRGICVDHEIDVIASKDDKHAMIEAKFRNNIGDAVILKDVMATWSAYQDVVEGGRAGICTHFEALWIITNGRFTERAEQFGVCKGITMMSWNSQSHSLRKLIDDNKLYPLTIIDNISKQEFDQLSKSGIFLCQQINTKNTDALAASSGMSKDRMQNLAQFCERITS
jgi:hypothetical protein